MLSTENFNRRVKLVPAVKPKEATIIKMLAEGNTIAETASTLKQSPKTIANDIDELKAKLNVKNIAHMVAFAIRENII